MNPCHARPQASDLKLSIRGSAVVKPEVTEGEHIMRSVTYVVPWSEMYETVVDASTLCEIDRVISAAGTPGQCQAQ